MAKRRSARNSTKFSVGSGYTPALIPGAKVEVPKTATTIKALGISGTTNWWGDPLVEANTGLIHQTAFGTAGSRTWGEWQRIAQTDPDISAVLDFICSPIRDANVEVEPYADHPDEKLAQAQADFVRWNILENVAPRWPDLLDQMSRGALTYGHSIHEVVLGLGEHETLPSGSGFVLRKLAERLPVSVHPTLGWKEAVDPLDQSRELEAIIQIGQQGSTFRSDIVLPAWKVLLCSWKRAGDNYRGVPFTRAVWYLAKIREQLAKLIGISMTREAAGIPTVQAQNDKSPDLSTKARRKLEKLLANAVYHENMSMVLPRGWEMKWIFSGGADKNHVLEVYNGLGNLILRQLGAQQLMLGSSSGSGSRAVGQVHSDTAMSYVQAVISMVESTLNGTGDRPYTGLGRKLIEPNWGPQPGYPRIKVSPKKSQINPLEKAQAAQSLVAAGALTITLDDENKFREDIGLAPIEQSDRDEEIAKKTPPQLQPFATGKENPGLPPPPGSATQKAGPKPPTGDFPQKKPTKMSFAPGRPLRPAEKVLDLQSMDYFLNTARKDFERAVRPEVMAMLTRAAPLIHEAILSGNPAALASLPLDTTRIKKLVDQFVEAGRAEGQRNVRAELQKGKAQKVAEKRALGDQSMAPVARFANEDLEDVDSQDVLDNIKDALLRKMVGRLHGQLEQEGIDALRTDGDETDVVSRVMTDQMDTASFRTDAGTALTKVYNIGRNEAAAMLGGVDRVQYSAILDGNTCGACEDMDGEEADFDSAEHDAMLPPNKDCDGGGNCRCVLVYIPKGADDDSED